MQKINLKKSWYLSVSRFYIGVCKTIVFFERLSIVQKDDRLFWKLAKAWDWAHNRHVAAWLKYREADQKAQVIAYNKV